MIYTDGIHLVADTLQELHNYASSVGIGRHWYEGVRKGHPHYDIPKKYVKIVLNDPKVEQVRPRDVLRISKQLI